MTDIWFCLPGLLEAWFLILTGDFLRYFLSAGGVFLVLWIWRRDHLLHRRIQATFPETAQMRREFAYSLSTVLVFSVVGLGIFLGKDAGIWRIYDDIGEWGWGYYALSIVVAIVAHDAFFYWTHRLMHNRRLSRTIHRTHHLSHNPSPWAAFTFDPAEALVQALFLPVFLLIVPIHGSAVMVFLIHMIVRNALGHSGFEVMPRGMATHPVFGCVTTVTHHDLHHSAPTGNYGLYFTWWDRVMGTEHPGYRDRYVQVTEGESARLANKGKTATWAAGAALVSCLVAAAEAGAQPPTILGDWATAGYEARVEIARCEDEAAPCGTIVWLWDPIDEHGTEAPPDPAFTRRVTAR